MTTNFNEAKLTKSDLRKVFMRSCTLDSAWNYERQLLLHDSRVKATLWQ